jgi:hypothetical protein
VRHRKKNLTNTYYHVKYGILNVKGKDIPVTGGGDPYVCERLRLPHNDDDNLFYFRSLQD